MISNGAGNGTERAAKAAVLIREENRQQNTGAPK
jgi:hypothetical protein